MEQVAISLRAEERNIPAEAPTDDRESLRVGDPLGDRPPGAVDDIIIPAPRWLIQLPGAPSVASCYIVSRYRLALHP